MDQDTPAAPLDSSRRSVAEPPHPTAALFDGPPPRLRPEDAAPATTTTRGGGGASSPGREPTPRLTAGQAAYVLGFHGVGSLVVSGGVNFGIACAMYLSPSPSSPISLLRLPNTLAGDAALTIIIQLFVTWLIEWASVTSDLRSGRIAPLSPAALPPFCTPLARRLLRLSPAPPPSLTPRRPASSSASTGEETARESESITARGPAEKPRPAEARRPPAPPQLRLADHLLRVVLLLVPSFVLFWPAAVGILIALGDRTDGGGDWVYASRWTPQVFKLVLGGLLGLLTTPPMALFWVLRAGEPSCAGAV